MEVSRIDAVSQRQWMGRGRGGSAPRHVFMHTDGGQTGEEERREKTGDAADFRQETGERDEI
eukprot:365203-Chlamydomonas_euryale.AAC.19